MREELIEYGHIGVLVLLLLYVCCCCANLVHLWSMRAGQSPSISFYVLLHQIRGTLISSHQSFHEKLPVTGKLSDFWG